MENAETIYDDVFYRYQREGALASAEAILPALHEFLSIKSVLDVGCGAGAWLRVHQDLGVSDIQGIDGDYVERRLLVIPEARFTAGDIVQPLRLGRRFDLVQCLEVAEHIAPSAGPALIENLVGAGDVVLFSAAVPGQGGKGHINERPLSYWRDLFAGHGYRAFDCVRPVVRHNARVDWWYRYNTLLYVAAAKATDLPESVLAREICVSSAVADVSPVSARMRRAVLRALPQRAVSELASFKHRQFVRALARG